MHLPRVSILLPFRNAADTLEACLDSIACQTLTDYEVLAVDDGSSDGSAALLAQRAACDSRLNLLPQPPLGLVAALNYGLAAARAPLVARMDADDLMHPERLARQLAYLEKHPHVDLLACRVRLFPEEGIQAGYAEYIRWQNACVTPQDIASEIYVESPLAHPSVMFRREVVQALGNYRHGDFPEDYDLWLRMAQACCVMAKLPQVLLDWRDRESRLSRVDPRCSREAFDRLRAKYLSQDPRLTERPLVYWGAGRKTRARSSLLVQQGFTPRAWVDVDPRKIGNRLDGVPVVAPQWLTTAQKKSFVLSYVANHGAREMIADFLHGIGFTRGEDYLMVG